MSSVTISQKSSHIADYTNNPERTKTRSAPRIDRMGQDFFFALCCTNTLKNVDPNTRERKTRAYMATLATCRNKQVKEERNLNVFVIM